MTDENEATELFHNNSHNESEMAGQSTTNAVNIGGGNSYENRLESFSAGCVYHDYSHSSDINASQATHIQKSDAVDTQLVTTLYHYGRYLLLSSGNAENCQINLLSEYMYS